MTDTTINTATCSERVAADRLNVARATLSTWRRKGLLNPAMFAPMGLRPQGRTSPKSYDADTIDKLVTGELDENFMFGGREAD